VKNFTFAHALAVVAGALPVLQQLLPGLLPPPYGIALGAIVGILGGLVHAATSAPTSGSLPPPSAGTVAKLHLVTMLVAVFLALSVLAGCATVSKVASDITAPTSQPYVTAAANGAVLLAESQGITAAQINGVAVKALAADSGTSATLATVGTVLNAQLAKLGLNAIESVVASALVSGLTNAINQQLQSNTSVAQVQAAIADVLNAVIKATTPLASSTTLHGFDTNTAWALANVPESAMPSHCVMLTTYPSKLVCTD
jgi:hypothetical protein